MRLANVLDEVYYMLGHPDVNAPVCAPADVERREQYVNRYLEYEQMARHGTAEHAQDGQAQACDTSSDGALLHLP